MSDGEILRQKLNLTDSVLDDTGKDEFLIMADNFHDDFSFKDELPEMDRLEHLGIIRKGLTGYSSLVLLVKRKNQNLYGVCSEFRLLNEKLLKINHAFPLVRDCIEQLGCSKCDYMSTIDLRDAFHTLHLAETSQKYCGIMQYYTYHYLCMGMGMSVSPQIW